MCVYMCICIGCKPRREWRRSGSAKAKGSSATPRLMAGSIRPPPSLCLSLSLPFSLSLPLSLSLSLSFSCALSLSLSIYLSLTHTPTRTLVPPPATFQVKRKQRRISLRT